jgi:hypothetical protein
MGYEDIVRYLSNNVPMGLGYADMLGWADDVIPNWRADAEMRDQVRNIFRDMSRPTIPERQRTIPEVVSDLEQIERDISQLPEVSFPEPEQKGFIGKAISKIKSFLGRLF